MTKSLLSPAQRQTVEIIEILGFGSIESLVIRDGNPCFETEPRIVQAIKLESQTTRKPDDSRADFRLKREFENLFDHLSRVREGVVDIEVRHGLPFRLVVARRCAELLTGPALS
jgi:hypothetical protein